MQQEAVIRMLGGGPARAVVENGTFWVECRVDDDLRMVEIADRLIDGGSMAQDCRRSRTDFTVCRVTRVARTTA